MHAKATGLTCRPHNSRLRSGREEPMVSRDYMLKKEGGPSAPKLFLDQKVIPAAIDAAGAVEGVLERVAVRVRRMPVAALAAALGTGTLVTLLAVPRRY